MADPSIKYGEGANFADENTSHARMLRLIGANKRVLEFGCSSGYMSRALQQHGCVVTGIELDPSAAELAKPFCERVIVADLDGDAWLAQLGDQTFDVAVFGDVLEHLKEPAEPLIVVKKLLRDDGYLVVSIPNIAHGSVRLSLLQGEFRYRKLGLLDDTHLRFFTRASVEELFKTAGYAIEVMERSTAGIFETEIAVNHEAVPSALLWRLSHDEEALTYQFVCKAVPTSRPVTRSRGRSAAIAIAPTGNASSRILMERLRDAEAKLAQLERQNSLQRATLEAVFNSKGWRLLNRYREAKAWIRTRLALAQRVLFWRKHESIGDQVYARWIENVEAPSIDAAKMQQESARFVYKPLVSIVMPVYNPKIEHLRKAIASVEAQIYDKWELCICDDASTSADVRSELEAAAVRDQRIRVHFIEQNSGISEASNRAIQFATGEFIGLLDHDDELAPHALHENVSLLQIHPEADLIYSDEDKLDESGSRVDPFFKPDWSPEYMMSCKYVCHFSVFRTELVKSIGGFRRGFEGSQDYDLVLRASERTGAIFHVPQMLYHWRKSSTSTAASAMSKDYATETGQRALQEHLQRRGVAGTALTTTFPNRYRVRPVIEGNPLVSIIIPTKDGVPLLKRCLSSIEAKTDYPNYEIVIVENNSAKVETERYLSGLQHRVLHFPEPFNYSRINNFAAAQAKGDYLLLLNNDVEVISSEWLTSMLELAQLPQVGAVGAKLYYPNNTIQHAGVVLGLGGGAGHSHKYFPRKSRGYFDSLVCIRDYSAVTAACMMVRRNVYEEVGGFDEQFRVAFNDVDFCLRVGQRGYRIVWTPYAELYHYESASRGHHMDPKELALLQQRWSELLQNDPYYNPHLTLNAENYALGI